MVSDYKVRSLFDSQFVQAGRCKSELIKQKLLQNHSHAIPIAMLQFFQQGVDIGEIKTVNLLPGAMQAA